MDVTLGICVCDIDDTLLRAAPGELGIWRTTPDGETTRLTTHEYAEDGHKNDPEYDYDFREFRDPEQIRTSIIRGTPILRNLKIVDEYINKGYDFSFLTARSCEDVIKDTLYDFLKYKTKNGSLRSLGSKFKMSLSQAVSDEKYAKVYDGLTTAQAKAHVLDELCEFYDDVVFLDDDLGNVMEAKALGRDNLTVIRAHK
jgi:hypothetical protein